MLEKKWHVVVEYYQNQKDGRVSNQDRRRICEQASISEHQLSMYLQRIDKTGTLDRVPGSGRKRQKFDLVNQTLREVVKEYEFQLSQLTLTELVRRRGVSVSSSTVNRVLNGGS